MITVISATNRPNSLTSIFAQHVHDLMQAKGAEVQYLSLSDLPNTLLHEQMYDSAHQSPELAHIQDRFIIPADKFYFVIPEYNGSFPGILKLFVDACSIRSYKESFHGGKKAGLLGVAAGRAGNLRGIDHFSGVLHYLQINVMPSLQPVSSIEKLVHQGKITDEATLKVLNQHVERFLAF